MLEGVEPFPEGVPNTVAILVVSDWWRIGAKYFIRKQFTLVLSWAFTTHKAQGKTLDIAVIDIGNSERFCSMNLFDLPLLR